ncbi:hypothetical protein DDZ15_05470 [Rhodohalobacter mucosus]|uniref:Uncharacterized protein n=2 Tax=Rhodohalobacter mucosus TaxID=2079485 RepID=A0A316TS86_9BACT|nr:hypothetical protein DDZ15_05470 [Rhodohalobacter mucosus]
MQIRKASQTKGHRAQGTGHRAQEESIKVITYKLDEELQREHLIGSSVHLFISSSVSTFHVPEEHLIGSPTGANGQTSGPNG